MHLQAVDDEGGDDADEDAPDLFIDYRDSPYSPPDLSSNEIVDAANYLRLASSKGIYPYRYITSFDKMTEDRLPEIAAFRNDLSDTDCSENDYARALEVWRTLQMENIRDYTIFYLCSDIMIMADVYSSFRAITLRDYGLDPARFYTAGSLGT